MASSNRTADANRKWRINWRHVAVMYGREFRSALRDKTVVTNSILIPIFLYPFFLWAALSLLIFVRGQSEATVARVGIAGWASEHSRLRYLLTRNENLVIVEVGELETGHAARIRGKEFDVFLKFQPQTNTFAPALPSMLEARITYDQTIERSTSARERLITILEDYRENWIKTEARKKGIDPAAWHGFEIALNNIATKRQMGGFVLGLTLPIIFSVMVAMGCFYPAVDTLAGERERGTWETLMSTAAQRSAILVAKYLHVVTFGGMAGALNLAAVLLTVKPIMQVLSPEAGQGVDLFSAFRAAPLMFAAALMLAGFIAAGMMVFAAFARTFKEGQAMITPFYLVIMVPIVFLQVPGLQLSAATACVPVVNLILMMRAALSGVFEWLPIAITFISSLTAISLALGAAAYVLKFEEVATGAYTGNLVRFLRFRVFKRSKASGAVRTSSSAAVSENGHTPKELNK